MEDRLSRVSGGFCLQRQHSSSSIHDQPSLTGVVRRTDGKRSHCLVRTQRFCCHLLDPVETATFFVEEVEIIALRRSCVERGVGLDARISIRKGAAGGAHPNERRRHSFAMNGFN